MAATVTDVLGLATAAGIILLGAFILLARPTSLAHRAFFLLAVMDGVSNLVFALRDMVDDPETKAYFHGTYYYFFIAFVALLLLFGLLYPRPVGTPRTRRLVLWSVIGVAGALLLAYVLWHDWFWTQSATGFPRGPGGLVVSVAFVGAATAVALKLGRDVLAAPSVALREQSAFVLGGVVLGYGPVFAGLTIAHVQTADRVFGSADPFVRAVAWAYVGAVVLMLAIGARLLLHRGALEPFVRRFLAATYALTALFTGLSLTDGTGYAISQMLGLLAYPALLAVAIVRADAFQINPQLRRATTLTLAGTSIVVTFVLLENFLQGFLEENLLDFIGSDLLIGIVSALLAAAVVLPLLSLARRLATKVLPLDTEHIQNLATYRLVLEGALEDGLLDARESRTLDALREALHISDGEHARLMRDVRLAKERATAYPKPAASAAPAPPDAPSEGPT